LINKTSFAVLLLTASMSFAAVNAQADGHQDAKAIQVLKDMAAYRASLDDVIIRGVILTDARLAHGLMVSNSEDVRVSISRPASMNISSFDGEVAKGLYFDDGLLTVYNSGNKLYAQAEIPKEIDAAMEFALEELDIEAPLMDLIYQDASTHLIGSGEEIMYLTDKSRVGGTDCHHLAIRGSEVDVQLWVEEGDRPVARKIMITSKWEGGSPRFVANLMWDTTPKFKPDTFKFTAPEGASKIEFVNGGDAQ